MNRNPPIAPELDELTLQRMPLFPLPQTVLFPQTVLPLHFFEPRYRALAQDCVEGSRVMALGTLEAPTDADSELIPPVSPVVTLGLIAAERRLPDGRWDIALRGLCRAEITAEHDSDAPYRVVKVRRLRDRERPDDRLAAADLRSAVVQVANRVPALWPQLNPLLLEARSPASLTDVVAGMFIDDVALRRTLLEELRVGRRLELLTDAMAGVLLDLTLRVLDDDDRGERLNH